jgi:hypothetical protein
MVIHNKELVKLVEEQRTYFNEDAPEDKKIDVAKRIEKLQKERKGKGDDQ